MKSSLLSQATHGAEPTALCPRCQSTAFYRDEMADVDGFGAVCPNCAREITDAKDGFYYITDDY